MSKFEVTKTIEAVPVNPRTGAPIPGSSVTIPYGGIIENLSADGDVIRFSYLGEPYQGPREVVSAVAAPVQPVEAAPVAKPRTGAAQPPGETPPPLAAEAALEWEQVKSNLPQNVLRARVPGGWLVSAAGAGLTFLPDPEHRWQGSASPPEPTTP